MSDTTHSDLAPPAGRDNSWLPGLPHAAAACATWPVFGGPACVTGLLVAALASFVVFLPLTALALNRGEAIATDAPGPELTRRAQVALLVLWTATTWLVAAAAAAAQR
jgi:hypothetical protein